MLLSVGWAQSQGQSCLWLKGLSVGLGWRLGQTPSACQWWLRLGD